MRILINLLINAIAIFAAANILPGIKVGGFGTALVVAIVLGVINAFIKPVLLILTLPINILTLGLFTLVINALLILLTSKIVPGFMVKDFWWAVLFGLVLSIIGWFLNSMSGNAAQNNQ